MRKLIPADRERIRKEVQAKTSGEMVWKKMFCGHQQWTDKAVDENTITCWACRKLPGSQKGLAWPGKR